MTFKVPPLTESMGRPNGQELSHSPCSSWNNEMCGWFPPHCGRLPPHADCVRSGHLLLVSGGKHAITGTPGRKRNAFWEELMLNQQNVLVCQQLVIGVACWKCGYMNFACRLCIPPSQFGNKWFWLLIGLKQNCFTNFFRC